MLYTFNRHLHFFFHFDFYFNYLKWVSKTNNLSNYFKLKINLSQRDAFLYYNNYSYKILFSSGIRKFRLKYNLKKRNRSIKYFVYVYLRLKNWREVDQLEYYYRLIYLWQQYIYLFLLKL